MFRRLKSLSRSRKRATRKMRRRARLYGRRTAGFRNPVRVEYKCVDITMNNQPVTPGATAPTSARFMLLNGLKPGSGINERIGRRILMKSLYVRGTVYGPNGSKTPPFNVRMICILDKQANAVQPQITDILREFDKNSGAVTDYSTPVNISNAARFSVVLDKTFTGQNYSTDIATGPNFSAGTKPVRIYKKMNLFTQYNEGTSGGVADITSGALYLIFMVDIDALFPTGSIAEADKPKIDLTARLRYID